MNREDVTLLKGRAEQAAKKLKLRKVELWIVTPGEVGQVDQVPIVSLSDLISRRVALLS